LKRWTASFCPSPGPPSTIFTEASRFQALRNVAALPTTNSTDSFGAIVTPFGTVTAAGSMGLAESSSHLKPERSTVVPPKFVNSQKSIGPPLEFTSVITRSARAAAAAASRKSRTFFMGLWKRAAQQAQSAKRVSKWGTGAASFQP
jgi:hypothetical protein